MSPTMSFQVKTQPMATAIVQTLRDYGEVPLGFVAGVVGRSPSEIKETVRRLQENSVLRINGDMVELLNETSEALVK